MNEQRRDSIEGNKAAQLKQDFDLSFALPPSSAPPEVEDLLMIRLGGDPYGIRLCDITEIITDRSIVPVPSVTPDLLGLTGIHGCIIPVFGLSSLLGYDPDPDSPRWMILCGAEEPIAFAFSDSDGYLRLPSCALHADEALVSPGEHTKYVTQVASTPNGARAVISMSLIMATIRNRIGQHRPTKEIST